MLHTHTPALQYDWGEHLHEAAHRCDLEVVGMLLDLGANVEATVKVGAVCRTAGV